MTDAPHDCVAEGRDDLIRFLAAETGLQPNQLSARIHAAVTRVLGDVYRCALNEAREHRMGGPPPELPTVPPPPGYRGGR